MNLEKLRAVRSRQVAAGHRRDGLGSYREFDDSSKLLDGRQCRDDSEVASGCDLPLGKRAQCVRRVSSSVCEASVEVLFVELTVQVRNR
jgi:hypothetical protein